MDMNLTGKTGLVTGSTRGIGLATAKGLAAMGATVIVNGRTNDATAKAAEAVRESASGANVVEAPGDLGTAEGCAAIIQNHPTVDILVNNMGIYEPKGFFEIENADWQKMFDVNVLKDIKFIVVRSSARLKM